MMSKIIRFPRISAASVLAVVAGLGAYMAPSIAISTPNSTTGIADGREDPQRLRLAQTPTGAAAASGLPGGASSLNETYKDWRVACELQGAAKRCVLSQVQTQQNGQRVLMVELNAPTGNSVSGALVLPFGLALDSGVTMQIDDKPAMQPVRFRTCLPVGCIVSVAFDAPTLVALRAGTVLKLKAAADGGAATSFSVSLQGFGTALDRMGALSR
jgi:invasion protein IalB